MGQTKSRIGIFLLLAILSMNNTTQGQSSIQLGIKDGDSFEFILEEFQTTDPDVEGYDFGYNEDLDKDIYLQEGDKFTITYTNATPYDKWENGDYLLDYEVSISNGQSFSDYEYLGENGLTQGRFVTSIDWVAQKTEFEKIFGELESDSDPNLNITNFEMKITDTNSEFGFDIMFNAEINYENELIDQFSVDFKIRFEKSNGVLGYEIGTRTYPSTKNDGSMVTLTESSALRRVGYSPNADEEDILAQLPGLEFLISALGIMTVNIIRKRQSKE